MNKTHGLKRRGAIRLNDQQKSDLVGKLTGEKGGLSKAQQAKHDTIVYLPSNTKTTSGRKGSLQGLPQPQSSINGLKTGRKHISAKELGDKIKAAFQTFITKLKELFQGGKKGASVHIDANKTVLQYLKESPDLKGYGELLEGPDVSVLLGVSEDFLSKPAGKLVEKDLDLLLAFSKVDFGKVNNVIGNRIRGQIDLGKTVKPNALPKPARTFAGQVEVDKGPQAAPRKLQGLLNKNRKQDGVTSHNKHVHFARGTRGGEINIDDLLARSQARGGQEQSTAKSKPIPKIRTLFTSAVDGQASGAQAPTKPPVPAKPAHLAARGQDVVDGQQGRQNPASSFKGHVQRTVQKFKNGIGSGSSIRREQPNVQQGIVKDRVSQFASGQVNQNRTEVDGRVQPQTGVNINEIKRNFEGR